MHKLHANFAVERESLLSEKIRPLSNGKLVRVRFNCLPVCLECRHP